VRVADAVSVTECVLTSDERERIERIASEFGDIAEEFFRDVRPTLSCAEWALLTRYAAGRVRRTLEVGLLLHALVETQQNDALPYPGRGRETFVRAALAAWGDSFAPIRDAGRLGSVFAKVEGGERRVLADVSTLEVMAANRMFASLDDQCAALLMESRE
jgi:hypothetical protein